MKSFGPFLFLLLFIYGCNETHNDYDPDSFEIIIGQDKKLDIFWGKGIFKNKKANRLNNLGVEFIKENQIDKAEQKFNAAYKIEPDNPTVLNNLGNIYRKNGFDKMAMEYYDKSLSFSDSTYPPAGYNMGIIYNVMGNYEESLKMFEYIISQTKDINLQTISKFETVRVLINQKKCPEAKSKYDEIRDAIMSYPEYKEEIAKLEKRLKDCFNQVFEVVWDDAVFKIKEAKRLNNLGLEFIKEKQIDSAEEKFIAAYRIEPDNPTILNNLGNIYQDKGTKNMALEYYNESFSFSDSTYFPAGYNIGITYHAKGEYERSIEMLEYIISQTEDKSRHTITKFEIVRVLINQNKCIEAKTLYDEIKVDLLDVPKYKEETEKLEELLETCPE